MKSIREKFVKDFGEKQALKVEECSDSHLAYLGFTRKNLGSDKFKGAIVIIISFQCLEVDGFRQYHNVGKDMPSWKVLKEWIKDNGKLKTYDGEFDVLSLLAGAYNEYM